LKTGISVRGEVKALPKSRSQTVCALSKALADGTIQHRNLLRHGEIGLLSLLGVMSRAKQDAGIPTGVVFPLILVIVVKTVFQRNSLC